MNRVRGLGGLAVLVAITLASTLARADTSRPVAIMRLDGTVDPGSLRYLERGLHDAAEHDAALVILELNTPGGLLVSLREMTTAITTSTAPVAVWVTPPGAHAASAGFFLVLAADVAAMAPGTTTGAAHPVAIGPGGPSEDGEPSAAMQKAAQDAAAFARTLAQQRGRSPEHAEAAVLESRSFAAHEARAMGLVDVVVNTREELLDWLHGRTVRRLNGSTTTLHLRDAPLVDLSPSWAERVLMRLGNPELAYLLLLVGLLALMTELTNPGMVIPGVVGAFCLLLGLYGFSVIPVSAVGVLLVLAGLALLVAEVFVISHGLLAVGGLTAFVLGSLMLVDTPVPEWRVDLVVVLPAALVMAAVILLLLRQAFRLRGVPALTGVDAMVGEVGEAVSPLSPDGKVRVHGEYWDAVATHPVPDGAHVRVVRIESGRLHVEPTP
ncbi:MAG: nodulation protein NfeD [Myxococcota bacterium]